MEPVEIMLGVILVLASSMFGSLLVLMYKFDKLQKTVDALKMQSDGQ